MNKSTVVLLVIVIVLGVVAYFLLSGGGEREVSYESGLKISIDSAAVTKVELVRPGSSVTLENVGGVWMVTEPIRYPANAATLTQLLGSFSKFKPGSLISSNPDKQTTFQVDSASATRVTLIERSGNSTSLLVGKTGPSYSEVYFRLPDSRDVYLGEGLTTWTLNQEVKEWRDKAILSVHRDSITGLELSYKKKLASLHRQNGNWYAGQDSIDASAISTALSAISSLRADDFIDSALTPVTTPLSVRLTAGDQTAIDFFPVLPDSSKYTVRTTKSQQLFTVGKYTIQSLIELVSKYGR